MGKNYLLEGLCVCLASKSLKLNLIDFSTSYIEERIKLAQSQFSRNDNFSNNKSQNQWYFFQYILIKFTKFKILFISLKLH